jgi:hypothetical protein
MHILKGVVRVHELPVSLTSVVRIRDIVDTVWACVPNGSPVPETYPIYTGPIYIGSLGLPLFVPFKDVVDTMLKEKVVAEI